MNDHQAFLISKIDTAGRSRDIQLKVKLQYYILVYILESTDPIYLYLLYY